MPYRENNYIPEERNKLEIKLESLTWSQAGEYCFVVLSKILKRKMFIIENKILEGDKVFYESNNFRVEYIEKIYLYIIENNNKFDITEKVSSEWPKKFFNILENKEKDKENREREIVEEELNKKKAKEQENRKRKKEKLQLKIEKKLNKLIGAELE